MARIVAAMAMTHSPGLTGWFDRAPEHQQTLALQALGEMRDRLAAARPDIKWTVKRVKEPTEGQKAVYESWLGQAWPAKKK